MTGSRLGDPRKDPYDVCDESRHCFIEPLHRDAGCVRAYCRVGPSCRASSDHPLMPMSDCAPRTRS